MPPRPACARCHEKKVKCNGLPSCHNCVVAQTRCEPHHRARRAVAYNELRERMSWFESEISSLFGIECHSIATHTPLGPIFERTKHLSSSERVLEGLNKNAHNPQGNESATLDHDQASPTDPGAADIDLLALNATGELSYLGPSSGSFFVKATTALAREAVTPSPGRHNQNEHRNGMVGRPPRRRTTQISSQSPKLSMGAVDILLKSFKLWTQPLFPLLNDTELSHIKDLGLQSTSEKQDDHLVHLLLVMALGATNLSNTIKQEHLSLSQDAEMPSAESLYEQAVNKFESSGQDFRPSLSLITTLLLFCMYSSHRATRYTQWQLAGLSMRMAVEMGLHSSHRNRHCSHEETDRPSRIFWTAYMIETSLAWNLGRPPSLDDVHISVELPRSTTPSLHFAIHHLRHRQIQSKIINTVYATSVINKGFLGSSAQLVEDLQRELDEWREQLRDLFRQNPDVAYPLKYWERLHGSTLAVLHRPSPLVAHPSASSLLRCVSSSGAYIECLLSTLRTSNVPLTWMLVQGLLFAGLTMLVVMRTHATRILGEAGPSFMLVDFPNWTRKCSICIAIMGERWTDGLLKKLDSQFEELANDTLTRVAEMVTNPDVQMSTVDVPPGSMPAIQLAAPSGTIPPRAEPHASAVLIGENTDNQWADTTEAASTLSSQWEPGAFFHDMLELESSQEFWNVFTGQSGFDVLGAFGDESIYPSGV